MIDDDAAERELEHPERDEMFEICIDSDEEDAVFQLIKFYLSRCGFTLFEDEGV